MNAPFRGLIYAATVSLVLWALLIGTVVFLAGAAHSAALCEHRSAAHVAEHGGLREDSAWHVAHGQLPTCGDDSSAAHNGRDNDRSDEGKSRYCRRRWFC